MRSDIGNGALKDELRLRRAGVGDARAIAEIVVLGWQSAYRDILPFDFLAGLSVAAREIAWLMRLEGEGEDDPTWVAESDRMVVGFVTSGPPRDKDMKPGRPAGNPGAAEIHAIYVTPDSWRKGAGRTLLTAAVDYWRKRGATTLVLWVLEKNAAGRRFYESMGWEPDGAREILDLGGFTATEVRYRLTS